MTTDSSTTADNRWERHLAELYVSDRQVREAKRLPELQAAMRRPGLSPREVMVTAMTGYADRPALGERATTPVTDPETGRTTLALQPGFDTISYRDLWSRVGAVTAEWYGHERYPLRANEFVGILGFASLDCALVDMACLRLGAVSVPMQSSASPDRLAPIIAETGQRILAASVEQLDTAVECALGSESVRRVIAFDYHPEVDDEREKFEAARTRLADSAIVLDSLAEVIDRGTGVEPAPDFEADLAEDRLASLIYTSGSTGTPKGAMYTDRLMVNIWLGFIPRDDDLPAIGLHYLPLSHVMGRAMLYRTLAAGGTSYFAAASDLSTLFEDFALVRPTELLLVPRVCDMLFQRYTSELARRTDESGDRTAREARVKAELRDDVLGGRVVWAGCGSAPLSAEMSEFVESFLEVPVLDGYGSTEAAMVLVDHKIQRPPVLDYKLDDVPELGYFTTDSPHPRGELLIRSSVVVPGYYKRAEATAAIFDADGYYRTGDVMAEIGPDELVYVDRRSNVLKLSQGEFVAVSQLEALFVTSSLIRQIYVYGNSERAYLLAVIVPTAQALALGEDLSAALRGALREIADEAGLQSYEVPRDFLVETEPFSTANGLLSEVRKLLRPRLRDHYGERLEQLYGELAQRETDELQALLTGGGELPVIDTVRRAAQAVLNTTDGVPADAHFVELGGDSLSALSFSNLLREIFGVEVPVSVVIGPASTLHRLAGHIEAAQHSGATRPTAASVHGADSAVCMESSSAWYAVVMPRAHAHASPRCSTAAIRNSCAGSRSLPPTISRFWPAISTKPVWAWTSRPGNGWPIRSM